MPDNTPYDFNTLVLVDAEEQAFAVLCTQQDTLYKGKRYSISHDNRASEGLIMGADKTNNIMTLSSGVSQPLLADVQYFELYSIRLLTENLKILFCRAFTVDLNQFPAQG
ncbi:hypothetical protein MS6204_00606 [Escherichia coli]|nr:hypothetical protein [Escherichia coli]NUV21736.1 hypothetical protein [Escherichia coli]